MSRILAIFVVIGFVANGFCADMKGNRFRKRQDEEKIRAVIEKIEGTVDVKPPKPPDAEEDTDWRAAVEKEEIDEGFTVGTGVKSKAFITLIFPNGKEGKVVIADLSEVVISDLKESVGDKPILIKTDLKFGKMKIDVKDTGVKFDWKIKMPNATTAITGTDATITAGLEASGTKFVGPNADPIKGKQERQLNHVVSVTTVGEGSVLIIDKPDEAQGGASTIVVGAGGSSVVEGTTATDVTTGGITTITLSANTSSETSIQQNLELTSLPSTTTIIESTTISTGNEVDNATQAGVSAGNAVQGTSVTTQASVVQQQSLPPLPAPPSFP